MTIKNDLPFDEFSARLLVENVNATARRSAGLRGVAYPGEMSFVFQVDVAGHDVLSFAVGDTVFEFSCYDMHLFPILHSNGVVASYAAENKFAGIPSVVTDCCRSRDFVEDGMDGLIMYGDDARVPACALRANKVDRDITAACADVAWVSSDSCCMGRYTDGIVEELAGVGVGL